MGVTQTDHEQQQPILSRLDRLDNLMRHLERLRLRGSSNRSVKSKSSSPSTPSPSSGGTRTSEDAEFFSPKTLVLDDLHCRPIDDVVVETQHKGTLLHRVSFIEQRLLKLCMQLEQEMEAEKQDRDRSSSSSSHENKNNSSHSNSNSNKKRTGLKQFVKSCVKGKPTKNISIN